MNLKGKTHGDNLILHVGDNVLQSVLTWVTMDKDENILATGITDMGLPFYAFQPGSSDAVTSILVADSTRWLQIISAISYSMSSVDYWLELLHDFGDVQ